MTAMSGARRVAAARSPLSNIVARLPRVTVLVMLCATPLATVIPAARVAGAGAPAVTPRDGKDAEGSLDALVGIVSQPFNIYTPTNGRFLLRVSNSVTSNRGARLEFLLHRRVSSREPLRAIAGGTVRTTTIDSVSLPLARVPRDNAGLLTPALPIRTTGSTSSSLTLEPTGVYPLTVRVTSPGGRVLASSITFLNRRDLGAPGPAVRVSTLVRISSVPSMRTDGLIEVSDAARATIRRSIDFLAATNGNVTVSMEPELLASLAASIEPADIRLLTDLRTQLARRTVATASFAASDPSLMAARRLDAEFLAQVDLGERTLDRYLPGVTIQRSTWVALHPLDEPGLALLRKAGITTVILTRAAQANLPSQRPLNTVSVAKTRGQSPMAIIGVDGPTTELLSGSVAFPEQLGYRIAAEIAIARDDLLAGGADPSSVRLMLSSPSGAVYENPPLLVTTRALAGAAGFAPTDMSVAESGDVLGASAPELALGPTRKPPADGYTTTLRDLRRRTNAVSSMLPLDDPQRGVWRHMMGLATSTAPENPAVFATALRDALDATIDSVTVTTPESINLSSRRATIRFQLRNDGAHDLLVRVRVSSAKLNITKQPEVVTLTAGATTEVAFPATTRTNGRFPVSVRLTTPEGNLDVVPSRTITARVSAVAGLGQLVSATLLLVLLAWWWSHRRSAAPGTDPESEGGALGDGTVGS